MNVGTGVHHLEVMGFTDFDGGVEQLEVHLPCDAPTVW
jgi:hypothetical protein